MGTRKGGVEEGVRKGEWRAGRREGKLAGRGREGVGGRNKGEKREKGLLARETPFSCQLSLYPRSKTSLRGIQLPLFYWGECKERFFGALRARTSDSCDMVHP